MKSTLLYIIFLFFFNVSYCQLSDNIFKIDSLKRNILTLELADSSKIAEAHFSIGEIYRKETPYSDSAYSYYYKAEKVFRRLRQNFKLAKTLHGIAVIQKNEKDFTGSEVTSIEAISLYDSLFQSNKVIKHKSFTYNNLGILFKELEQYDKSIEYHFKALKIKKKLTGDNRKSIYISKNNIGNVYKEFKKYDLALQWFKEVLDNKILRIEDPNLYVLLLGNYGHTLFLSKKNERLPNVFLEALHISNNIKNNNYNSIIINQHLAEYYNSINKKDSAKFYAYKAKAISELYHNDDLLKSLLLLSEIEKDSIALIHSHAYIELSDSLQKKERSIRNKFARIRFETNEIEQENKQITKERMWLLLISIIVIIASLLLYLVIYQRNKNKELQFIQKQQEANEEIYNLMLSQNENVEEARALEKKRISQDLHDGILGRLFGTRLSLDSLNMSSNDEAIKAREQYIGELKIIEEDIRKVSHELNTDFILGSGFIDIIKTFIEKQSKVYKLSYELNHDDDISWDLVNNKEKIHVYRIIQEAIHNIYKHANATHIIISFVLKNNMICLKISDNGSGFNINKTKSGIGLKNLNSRIKEINGILEIASKKHKGTQIVIKFPAP